MEEMASRAGIPIRSTPVSEAEMRAASEVWISSSTREVQPVTLLDDTPVGSGKPGPLWRRVYDELQSYKRELSGTPW
jgi:D-alanine transaminase